MNYMKAVRENKSISTLFIIIAVFFLFVNTRYFWEEYIPYSEYFFLFLVIVYCVLSINIIIHIIKGLTERFCIKRRNYNIIIGLIILPLTFIFPYGIFSFKKLLPKEIFIAERIANRLCIETITLKEQHKFTYNTSCFWSVTDYGSYSISNDTIYFNFHKGYKCPITYGVIHIEDTFDSSNLLVYDDRNNYLMGFYIIENNLNINQQ